MSCLASFHITLQVDVGSENDEFSWPGVSTHGGTPKSLGLPLFQETSILRGHNVVDRPNDLLLRTVGVIETLH